MNTPTASRSHTDDTHSETGTDDTDTDEDADKRRIAQPHHTSLGDTRSGWPVDLSEIFAQIYAILLVGYSTLYSGFFQAGNDMTLGILRFLGVGAVAGSGEEGDEGIGMEKREVVGNTKRRRRVEGAGTDCESNPPCFGWEEAGLTGVADKGFYPGMVNLSGTLCYMNSVLQV